MPQTGPDFSKPAPGKWLPEDPKLPVTVEASLKALRDEYDPQVLVAVVTKTEFLALRARLRPPQSVIAKRSARGLLQHIDGPFSQLVARLGELNCVVVKAIAMGAGDVGAMAQTIDNAIKLWQPSAVINVGIAWGAKPGQQKLGDVLISTHVVPYENIKITPDKVEFRAAIPSAGMIMRSRFSELEAWWPPHTDDCIKPHAEWYPGGIVPHGDQDFTLFLGPMLAATQLLADAATRTKLLADVGRNCVGGEMEGWGLYASAQRHNITEWILVKGICDWGDEHKADGYQPLAAATAVQTLEFAMKHESFLSGIPRIRRGAPSSITAPLAAVDSHTTPPESKSSAGSSKMIFICCAATDSKGAAMFKDAYKAAGVQTFVEHFDIPFGQPKDAVMVRALQLSSAAVVLISEQMLVEKETINQVAQLVRAHKEGRLAYLLPVYLSMTRADTEAKVKRLSVIDQQPFKHIIALAGAAHLGEFEAGALTPLKLESTIKSIVKAAQAW
ncbi:hypothetical protein WJX72_006962 [[Myrmecia] bisecta]|uniref:TIR domain-containing protein n=1 Tax=[Myrmecia] bisecta TaxID=41462 RepID=A0AAW1Q153_9CHLO